MINSMLGPPLRQHEHTTTTSFTHRLRLKPEANPGDVFGHVLTVYRQQKASNLNSGFADIQVTHYHIPRYAPDLNKAYVMIMMVFRDNLGVKILDIE